MSRRPYPKRDLALEVLDAMREPISMCELKRLFADEQMRVPYTVYNLVRRGQAKNVRDDDATKGHNRAAGLFVTISWEPPVDEQATPAAPDIFDEPVVRRVVPASQAARLQALGPCSVFDLAQRMGEVRP